MNSILCVLLAVLSIWDYPSRQRRHVQLRNQFVAAVREGDTETMRETCEKGVKLLPEDPTWRYNLACSLAYYAKCEDKALDELEKAIDLGFRDSKAIAADQDLKRLAGKTRFLELVEYADIMSRRPIMSGPMANVEQTGIFGTPVAIGDQNCAWDFDAGCFIARLKLAPGSAAPNVGDLYMNRDRGHSNLNVAEFPGLTRVTIDEDGRKHDADRIFPNMSFPYPLFGNCSMAFTEGPFWRSLPRALVTTDAWRLAAMMKFYVSNQVWVFPCNADCPPVGTKGDVFASVCPYWFVSAGASFTDLPVLRAALEVSRSLKPEVKAEIVRRGLLAPTVQTIVRQSFRNVVTDRDYLSPKAHPTAISGGNIDIARVKAKSKALTKEAIAPLAAIKVRPELVSSQPVWPELTYATSMAWAYVLRSEDKVRTFVVTARGAEDYEFAVVHDEKGISKLGRTGRDSVRIVLNRTLMSPTNRVDLAVFGRNASTGWGAPSYVSFAVVDPTAPYSDPALTPLGQPKEK